MAESAGGDSKRIYQLKLTLKHIKPPIWRCVEVPADCTLDGLHLVMQHAMGWNNCHLHEFRKDMRSDRLGNEKNAIISQYLIRPKDKMFYVYDFGDDWEHEIMLKKILEVEPNVVYPRCVGGKRACPPEDVGGPYGYQEHLQIIADPKHEDYKDRMEWVAEMGFGLDPEKFDINEIVFL